MITSEQGLIAAAVALGATDVGGKLSRAEVRLVAESSGHALPHLELEAIRGEISGGGDPLGDAFSLLRTPEVRRGDGATYTPAPIVNTMVSWAAGIKGRVARIVDPGVGSGRFLAAAGAAITCGDLIGIDTDPVATLMARANLAVLGVGDRAKIINGDFREFSPGKTGKTLFIGNPPYVRHHQIDQSWKSWLGETAAKLGLPASKLAGLHVHFFLATAAMAKPGDIGAFITASEWLDVNYGALVRSLMLGKLGGKSVSIIEPTARPFPDADTTAAITTFEIGSSEPVIRFQRVDDLSKLSSLSGGKPIGRGRLSSEARWSHMTRTSVDIPEGFVELGEICRVHRGAVTGSNGIWIAGSHSEGLPQSVLFPTITKAREVIESAGILKDHCKLRRVIDIPSDLDELSSEDKRDVELFLKIAKEMGGDRGYVARNRKSWWSVGLKKPAPIISTYMARRAPEFTINSAAARHINIAHGLYPREPMNDRVKAALVKYLRTKISQQSGRTYSGGLTKFEPREMERLSVPGPQMLEAGVTF